MPFGDVQLCSLEVRKLLSAACPEAALLFLFLKNGGAPENAAQQLKLNARQFDLAQATLRQLGLLPEDEPRHLRRAEGPCFSEQDVQAEYAQNPEFPTLVGEVQRRFGRVLSTEEVKTLLCIYRYLGLTPEAVSMLVHYCIARAKERTGRMPAMRMIEKEAYVWADAGIQTIEQAAAYTQEKLRRKSRLQDLQQLLQLGTRNLTAAEEKYLDQWIAWGFSDEVIASAYEKTCLQANGMKWPYMNAILKSWQEKGLFTPEDIAQKDQKASRPQQRTLSDVERRNIARMMNRAKEE